MPVINVTRIALMVAQMDDGDRRRDPMTRAAVGEKEPVADRPEP
jgi:hypothetical protein